MSFPLCVINFHLLTCSYSLLDLLCIGLEQNLVYPLNFDCTIFVLLILFKNQK